MIIEMRKPCKYCGKTSGLVEEKNGQHTVSCAECGRHNYNAPKNEIGLSKEPKTCRKPIDDVQRARIMERDGFKCIICGRSAAVEPGLVLHVSHIISVKDADALAKKYGVAVDAFVNKDFNLFASCSNCNLGQGGRSIIPAVSVFISAYIAGKASHD